MLKPGGLIQTRYGADCLLDPKQQSCLAFDCVATLTGCWKTTDPKVLLALDALHIVGPEFLEARLRWKPTQPLTIMEVRAYRLLQPILVPPKESYWGCFSWVDIDGVPEEVTLQALLQRPTTTPALSDEVFAERQVQCREALQGLRDVEEVDIVQE